MATIIRRKSQPYFLTDLQDEINRLFDFSGANQNASETGDFAPAIDIKDEKDHYLIRADVPGVDPKNIEVTLNDSMLTIRGQKETETKENREGYIRVERSKGSFCRQLTLPESVDGDAIIAKSKNGVLEISIPKAKRSSSRKIEINED